MKINYPKKVVLCIVFDRISTLHHKTRHIFHYHFIKFSRMTY